MKKNEDRKKARQRVERKVWTIAVLIFVVTICLGYGGVMYAKYYSQGYEKGVAVASAIYFSANHAFESDESDIGTEKEYVPSLVLPMISGTEYNFDFEVRNFENNLLFNDSGVKIPYKISFWLGETPIAATYTVSLGSESKTFNTDEVTFENQSIEGGAARVNPYKITVKVSESDTQKHERIPVFVKVETLDGSPVQKVLKGQMVFSSVSLADNFIDYQQFVLNKTVADDAEWFTELQKLSALTYEIRTVGAVTGNGATEKIKLIWNPNVLEIDLFDETYKKWMSATGKTVPDIETDTETNGWYSITIDAMPYSSETVTFFRGKDFDTNVADKTTLHSFIKAEMANTDD